MKKILLTLEITEELAKQINVDIKFKIYKNLLRTLENNEDEVKDIYFQ